MNLRRNTITFSTSGIGKLLCVIALCVLTSCSSTQLPPSVPLSKENWAAGHAGKVARLNGEPESSNPYPEHTDDFELYMNHIYWTMGWYSPDYDDIVSNYY